MLNAVGVAALGLLVFDPRQLFTASFQMTFVCVLIVAAIAVPILQRTSQLHKQALAHWDSNDYAAFLPPRVAQFRVDLQFIAARLALFVGEKWSSRLVRGFAFSCLAAWELIFVSAVMQMGLALPMVYYFHRATTDRIALQPDRRSVNAINDARRSRRACSGFHLAPVARSLVSQSPGASDHVGPRPHHRHGSRTGLGCDSEPFASLTCALPCRPFW